MKIYTLTGDDGTTSLAGGKRVPKHSARVNAYGSVDELIAWIGLLKDLSEDERKTFLAYIQSQLMYCAATLAAGPGGKNILPEESCVTETEKEIDMMQDSLAPLKNFLLPGGHIIVSYCHIARCVCRRAERAVSLLNESEKSPETIGKFLNRLSDYLFVLSRKISSELDIQEVKWP